ncbi:MAG: anaerobic ribonucleoside-triphosphate reductase activating protein [Treponema sp.]|nr:anaerobic ribonucleoside-triphosphate reductase activating protein [Treponema sp.]
MRLSGITPESIVDGPGLRYVIFTQGCPHCCTACHNPESWDFNAGKEFSVKEIIRLIKKQKKPIQGITFSGGEPFTQAGELAVIAQEAHQIGWDVVTYTGYTYEQLLELGKNDKDINNLFAASDILIDGKYIDKLKTINLPFRGSINQRMINMAETLKIGSIVPWKEKK